MCLAYCCFTTQMAAGGVTGTHLDVALSLDEPIVAECRRHPWSEWSYSEAAAEGRIDILDWLRTQGPPRRYELECESICEDAHNNLEVLKWLRAHDPPFPWNVAVFEWAARAGNLGVLKWLQDEDPEWLDGVQTSTEACNYAALGRHLPVLAWLRAQTPPYPWDSSTCSAAAEAGSINTLWWLRSQDPPCPWGAGACAAAASRKRLDTLAWLRSQDPPCPWDAYTCASAARWGRFRTLKWLRLQTPPCPWDVTACRKAAASGHLRMLRWLRAQVPPCPWDEDVCDSAARTGHLHILKWALSQNPPCPWTDKGAQRACSLSWTTYIQNLDMIVWVRDTYDPDWEVGSHGKFLNYALWNRGYGHIKWVLNDARRCDIALEPASVKQAQAFLRAVDQEVGCVLPLDDVADIVRSML